MAKYNYFMNNMVFTGLDDVSTWRYCGKTRLQASGDNTEHHYYRLTLPRGTRLAMLYFSGKELENSRFFDIEKALRELECDWLILRNVHLWLGGIKETAYILTIHDHKVDFFGVGDNLMDVRPTYAQPYCINHMDCGYATCDIAFGDMHRPDDVKITKGQRMNSRWHRPFTDNHRLLQTSRM